MVSGTTHCFTSLLESQRQKELEDSGLGLGIDQLIDLEVLIKTSARLLPQ